MKKKKIASLILSVVMALGLSLVVTACGEEPAQEEEQTTTVETEEAATEETTQLPETVDEYVELAGEYQDEYSQRASATVITDAETQSVNITVMWSGSATTASMWTMNATKEGNQLVYSDCVKTELIYSDDTDEEGTGDEEIGGGAEETVVYENGSGSFEISEDGKLLWTGAEEPECQSCVFVRAAE